MAVVAVNQALLQEFPLILMPVLLELLGSAIPVAQWPTQVTKREGH
ncbi:hypothetical protein ACFWR9_10305 [Streptomyces sp. NPDC058534]